MAIRKSIKTLVLFAFGLFVFEAVVDAIIPAVHVDDPEPYEQYTTPRPGDDVAWWRETSQAKHTGYLFAGRTEFPWIVDIRQVDLDQELWSTGNLITFLHVLTACRAVGYWKYEIKENDLAICINEKVKGNFPQVKCGLDANPNNPTEAPWWRLHWQYYTGLKVSYAPIYLWEDYKSKAWDGYEPHITEPIFPKKDEAKDDDAEKQYRSDYLAKRRVSAESGSRNVIQAFRHVWCDQETVEFDIGVLKLQKGIWPIQNVVHLMPPVLDFTTTLKIPQVNLTDMNLQGRVCYVASWGRSYVNWFHHMVIDYKVKYRVYYRDLFSDCGRAEQRLEFQRIHQNKPVRIYSDSYFTTRLWCFKTFQRIGSVCDHDRGAPLVCDGQVYGIVVRGAKLERCSNLVGQPFLVMRLSEIDEYWAAITTHLYDPKYVHINLTGYSSDLHRPDSYDKYPHPQIESLGNIGFNPLPLMIASHLIGLYFRLLL